ncbi:hypothetical protein HY003_01840 [Candidatus Saccharibacteria bacterium]|nr:hypothetical protein [Candidatus Saccharibacteria bacterium]MBI3338017.1 hypothetical protein [Candidatus Saccharibacteria bacterium]
MLVFYIFTGLTQNRPSPDRLTSATNSFSSLDVAKATSPSDKTVFARADSPWERGILRKSSRNTFHAGDLDKRDLVDV